MKPIDSDVSSRHYGPTRLRGRVKPGQIWQSTQARDRGRLVRIVARKEGRILLAPLGEGHLRTSVSEMTLRKVYALVAFQVTDGAGRAIGPVETHSAALRRRMELWATHADKRFGVMLEGGGLAHPIVDGYAAFNARNSGRKRGAKAAEKAAPPRRAPRRAKRPKR